MRRRFATYIQLIIVPNISPIIIHIEEKPPAKAAPGSPISSHPLMSEDSADIAATHLLFERPASV